MSDPLLVRLKQLIIEELRLEDVTTDDIQDEEPLIESGLSLDSLDVLELVLKIEKQYGIKIKTSEESREALASVASLAAFIRKNADPDKLSA